MVDLREYAYRSLCHGCGKFIFKYEGAWLYVRTASQQNEAAKADADQGQFCCFQHLVTSLHSASLREPQTGKGLKVILWLELSLQAGQIVDQAPKGDSLLVVLLPALPHQFIHLPDMKHVCLVLFILLFLFL